MSPKAAKRGAARAKATAPAAKSRAKGEARTMSASHKEALAHGRTEGRSVRIYLEALEAQRPKRGRKRTIDTVKRQLAEVQAALPNADPLRRLQLVQQQMNLKAELAGMSKKVDPRKLEGEFVSAAKGYSQRKGISYSAWRSVGVPAAVLRRAGIGRGD